VKVSIPKGTQDFLPAAALPRRYVIDRLIEGFEAYGFEPLETPAFEKIETLLGKYGEEGEKLIFKILKRGEGAQAGEADLALRYDLTVPLARVVAMYPELPRPFKRYQIAPVWRAEKPQRGRYREFYQCDADVAGSTSPVVEIELLTMAHGIYAGLGFTDFTLQLNHRRVLSGLIHAAGIDPGLEVGTLITLDKLDKVGPDGVRAELLERGITPPQLAKLDGLLTLQGTNAEVLEALTTMLAGHAWGLAGLDNLRTILTGLEHAGVPEARVVVNPVLARGLGYYTGAIYEVVLAGFSSSIGSGGRYDNLVGMFSGRPVPACGFSFGLDRMLLLLGERGLLPKQTTRTQVLVPVYSDAVRDETLRLAAELRAFGFRVDVYPDPGKLGVQMQYGTARGIPFAAIVGPDELANRQVTVRDLRTRAQETMDRSGVIAWLQEALAREQLASRSEEGD
jgi:histidyl-tRNA synthetase